MMTRNDKILHRAKNACRKASNRNTQLEATDQAIDNDEEHKPYPTMKDAPHYTMRRILGERTNGGKRGKKEYLVEWFPSWTPASGIRKGATVLEDWKEMKRIKKPDRYVLPFRGCQMLRDNAPTANNHEEMQRLMFETAMHMAQKELGIILDEEGVEREDRAAELIEEADWDFAEGAEKKAANIAHVRFDEIPTAGALLKMSYRHIIQKLSQGVDWKDQRLPYGDIRLRFTGQLNEELPRAKRSDRRPVHKISSILEPIFEGFFEQMEARYWSIRGDCEWLTCELKNHLRSICVKAPFLLKNDWILFFTRVFIPAVDLAPLLESEAGIKVTKDWLELSRNYLMQVYREEEYAKEFRAPADIQETYFSLRDFFIGVTKPDETDGENEREEESNEEIETEDQQEEKLRADKRQCLEIDDESDWSGCSESEDDEGGESEEHNESDSDQMDVDSESDRDCF